MIEIKTGDFFSATEKYIVHQCNCVTQRAAHLAKDVFTKYPYADIYTNRTEANKPGTIVVCGNGQDQRYVINLLGQYYPGKPKYPYSSLDGFEIRQKYFYQGLLRIAKIPNLESVAFPWKISCGAAGGSWPHYLGNLTNFANHLEKQNVKVVIYQRENDD
jgi:O-acetyl-ADP-ribose deacetylase (regulator of RNase III)